MTNPRIRIVIVGLVVPLLMAAAAAIVMASWLPSLPAEMAIHWSDAGADGYGPVWLSILLPLLITGAFVAFSTGTSLPQTRQQGIGTHQRFLLVTGVWLSVFLSFGLAGSLAIQRAGAAPVERDGSGVILLMLAMGAVLGGVLALIAWWVLPTAQSRTDAGDAVEPFAVADSERLTWIGTARLSTGVLVPVSIVILIGLAAVAGAALSSPRSGGFLTAGVVLVISALLIAVTGVWRVSADSRGLIVRSWLGWPRVRVRADDIEAVRLITVGPGGEFGGYGIRWGLGGRMGIILRPGIALEVTRSSGHTVLVTVDDAATAARVLGTYLEAARSR